LKNCVRKTLRLVAYITEINKSEQLDRFRSCEFFLLTRTRTDCDSVTHCLWIHCVMDYGNVRGGNGGLMPLNLRTCIRQPSQCMYASSILVINLFGNVYYRD